MSEECDVIIHDTDDGVVLVVDNRDKVAYTMRFDFGASENLKLSVPADVETVGPMKCNIVVEPGTLRNLCELIIEDSETKQHFEMRYKVQCLVKNPKTGELEEVKPPPQAAADADDGEEERKEITKTLYIIIKDTSSGYILFFENLEKRNEYICTVDMSNSENLAMEVGPGVKATAELICDLVSKPGRAAFARLNVKDRSVGTCALSYKVKQRLDTSKEDEDRKKKEAEEAARKKAEEDEAARKKAAAEAAAAAAKKKAEDDAAKRKAEEEAAAKKKAEDEAAKRKADEDAARKKAEDDERKRKEAEAAEAARKKREEDEARKKAEEEALRKKAAEAEAARRAAELERIRLEYEDKFKKLFELEISMRARLEVEWRGHWVLIERKRRESMCNLCRGLLKEGQQVTEYKQYRLHQPCYDKCPKCDFCGDLLIGGYVVTKGDIGSGTKLHKECIQPYKESCRPGCGTCGNKIMDEKWATVNGQSYHQACVPA